MVCALAGAMVSMARATPAAIADSRPTESRPTESRPTGSRFARSAESRSRNDMAHSLGMVHWGAGPGGHAPLFTKPAIAPDRLGRIHILYNVYAISICLLEFA
ncbi:hypothetical protein DS837_30890 [Azospirillum brasilense]|uniref:Uncharacterized protein n=1 Tax=Azospirillum brasilense TaxID=192 RepID=A0A6L3ARC0_AZOBR|nr:hypothetical protein DS837_30890 [Azospirillum brasilense]